MGKLTVAKINEIARGMAIAEIAKNGLGDFLQVDGTKYAKDFEFETEEGKMTRTVRIDIVVPKLEEGEDAKFLAEDYQLRLKDKAEKAKAREEAKAKKIARDEKLRAKKKAEKEAE